MYFDTRKIVRIEYSLQHYKYVLLNNYNNMIDGKTFNYPKEAEEYAAQKGYKINSNFVCI